MTSNVVAMEVKIFGFCLMGFLLGKSEASGLRTAAKGLDPGFLGCYEIEMQNQTLEGKFIRLEPLTADHLKDLEADFDPSLFDYYPKSYPTAREFVEENLEMLKSGTFLPYAIVLQSTGEAIGCTEFSGIDEKNRKLEIGGSWLKPRFHGSAANSEAKLLLLQHAFENLGFVRVQLTANALNARSRAGIEKIGGRFEGILRNAMILPDGKLRDDAYYSVIQNEWSSVKIALRKRIESKPAQS